MRLEAGAAQRRLAALGVEADGWPPGPSYALPGSDAVLRLGDPEPGEGYHREHVRLLRGAGEGGALAVLCRLVVESQDPRLRLEAESLPALDPSWSRALEGAGLELEGVLPDGWSAPGGEPVDLHLHGRPGRPKRLTPPPRPDPPVMQRPPIDPSRRGSASIVAHEAGTRATLRRFLDALVPGRSYPPGTLLSEAERGETRRRGDLEADWVLALDPEERVVGGVVLERDRRPERAHVRRLHVDVLADWRGLGLARDLLGAAGHRAEELGAQRVEADPRAGHEAVVRALSAAGLSHCARRRAAWRMRTAIDSWDEDVALLSAPTGRPFSPSRAPCRDHGSSRER